MPCTIKNPANIDLSELEPHVQGMYDYFDQKIGFNRPPTMVFGSDSNNQSNVLGKTAYYDPDSLQIFIYSDGRHPKDMLRSIAHELIHHRQNLEGRLNVGGYHGEGYYLKNKKLKKLEQEAMKYGNELMREYEDSLKLKEKKNMSLKEWKNNELTRLLMERFGIAMEYHKGTPTRGAPTPEDELNPFDYERKGEIGGRVFEDTEGEETYHYGEDEGEDERRLRRGDLSHGHRSALKKDMEYDEEHEYRHEKGTHFREGQDDLEETVSGRKDPRNRKSDENTNLRPMEEDVGMATEDALEDDGPVKESRSLKETVRKALKNNKRLRVRFK